MAEGSRGGCGQEGEVAREGEEEEAHPQHEHPASTQAGHPKSQHQYREQAAQTHHRHLVVDSDEVSINTTNGQHRHITATWWWTVTEQHGHIIATWWLIVRINIMNMHHIHIIATW